MDKYTRLEMKEFYKQRGAMEHFCQAVKSGKLKAGYFGGSITDGSSLSNWPHFVNSWLLDKYDGLRLTVENLALGATGSDLAVMRCDRDMKSQGCDIVFIEYAVNDGPPTEIRNRSREGLLRKLLRDGDCDVVVVYTFMQDFYKNFGAGELPPSILEFEALCEHYNLSSVFMSSYSFSLVKRGLLRWEEWLPDNLHPQFAGSRLYAKPVCALLKAELHGENNSEIASGNKLPLPVNEKNWEKLSLIDYDDIHFEGPVRIERSQRLGAVEHFISTSAIGTKISIPFTGTGLIIADNFGSDSGEFLLSLDGDPAIKSCRERPDWAGKRSWLRTEILANDLPYGDHICVLEMVYGDSGNCTSACLEIGLIAVIK